MTDREAVEQKFKMPLKDVMYDVCVIQGMDKWEGADYLGVPQDTFKRWRTQYRFGPMQMAHDRAVEYGESIKQQYQEELANVNLLRKVEKSEEHSFAHFKEIIGHMLEIEKYKHANNNLDSHAKIASSIKIGFLDSTLEHINKYESGELYEEYLNYKADMERSNKS